MYTKNTYNYCVIYFYLFLLKDNMRSVVERHFIPSEIFLEVSKSEYYLTKKFTRQFHIFIQAKYLLVLQ
jgi:hypothetical protein